MDLLETPCFVLRVLYLGVNHIILSHSLFFLFFPWPLPKCIVHELPDCCGLCAAKSHQNEAMILFAGIVAALVPFTAGKFLINFVKPIFHETPEALKA